MTPRTIPALFLNAVETYDKPDAFLHKKDGRYVAVSHGEVLGAVRKATCGLLALGLVKGDRVALISENRLEWIIADLAILSAGCVNVPIYATLPPGQVEYILFDAEVRAVFVSGPAQYAKIAPLRGRLPQLQHVFTFDPIEGETGVVTLDKLLRRGGDVDNPRVFEDRLHVIAEDDTASIIYTSGTTGDPKGVVLTHSNFVSNVASCTAVLNIDSKDCCLSSLPLSHALERTGGYYAALSKGVTIAYAESFHAVRENIREVRPTFIISVPGFFERMYERVSDRVAASPAARKKLFAWALRAGSVYARQTIEKRVTLAARLKRLAADTLVLKKFRTVTGGRVRFCISGGAPLSREIAEFFWAVGLPLIEGYGTTEACPVLTLNTLDAIKLGSVGKPLPQVEIRIADDGEILARGPNIMHGYFKRPDLTAEAIRDGWYHTGDIGYIDSDGFLVITDRKKDIIVTSGGKNVAPQLVERVLKTSEFISEVLVLGDKRRFVSAIIVPNFHKLEAWAASAGISYANRTELVRNPAVIKKLQEEIKKRSDQLAGFERVRRFVLRDRHFTVEEGDLTPTLKLKRRVVETKLAKDIEALYSDSPSSE
jgi:long-chain acyl-CoA synthetase